MFTGRNDCTVGWTEFLPTKLNTTWLANPAMSLRPGVEHLADAGHRPHVQGRGRRPVSRVG